MGDLRDQVEKEAKALDISVEDYYKLPVSMRVSMGLSDIGEGFSGDGLGTLNSEMLAEYSTAARNELDKQNEGKSYTDLTGGFDEGQDSDLLNKGYVDPNTMGTSYPESYDIGFGGTDEELTALGNKDYLDTIGGGMDEGQSEMYDNMTPTYTTFNDPFVSDAGLFSDGEVSIFDVPIGPGGPSGPGAGSNIGDGDGGGGGGGDITDPIVTDPIVTDPIVTDPIVTGDGDGVIDGGGGSGVTFSDPLYSRPSSNFGLTLDDVLVPSTVNYGTDPRFANLAPTFTVSKAAMPTFAGIGSLGIAPPPLLGTLPTSNKFNPPPLGGLPPYTINPDEEESGVVSLAEGGTPKGQGIMPDFMVDSYLPSLIPQALAGSESARSFLLDAHSNFDNFTLPEELFLKIKYGRASGGIASLNDTARNMFRPMVG
jgi:hypothetical protein